MQCNSYLSFNFRFGKSCPCACHEGIWSNGGLALLILIFDTRWNPVVSFTFRPTTLLQGKSPRYPGCAPAPAGTF